MSLIFSNFIYKYYCPNKEAALVIIVSAAADPLYRISLGILIVLQVNRRPRQFRIFTFTHFRIHQLWIFNHSFFHFNKFCCIKQLFIVETAAHISF